MNKPKFDRNNFITLNGSRLFTAKEVADFIRKYDGDATEERKKVLDKLYDCSECIPLKEYASDFDQGFHQAMTLVRGWIKQSLREAT